MRRSTQAAQDPSLSKDDLKRLCERSLRKALGVNAGPREVAVIHHAAEQMIEHNNPAYIKAIGRMKRLPVTIDEFVNSEEFLGKLMEVWPTLMPDLRDMNPDVFVGEEPCFEVMFGGGTGTGKTHLSQITNKFQLYMFTCFHEPQRLFNLTPNTPIVFMFQSVSTTITKRVIYMPFRANFLGMPYTQRWVKYDKYKDSELVLEGNLQVVPAQATIQAMVGQAIPGGILDEVNFMSVIESSKQVAGPAGMGGHYDQAEISVRNIERRRKRSFLTKGPSLGCLCIVSSTRYRGDFLDRRMDEVEQFEEKNILVLRRKQYEVAPAGRYAGPKFQVLIGTNQYPTRVLTDVEVPGVHYPENAHIENVPIELKTDFMRDPEAAQRDYCGIATNAITPFIAQRGKIVDAIMRGEEMGLRPWVVKQDVDLLLDGMPEIVEENLPRDRSTARYAHIDLSSTADRCGLAIVKQAGNQAVVRDGGMIEVLPVWIVECAISIQPSPTKELDPSEVRQFLMRLVNFYNINIECVSYDGFQSNESILLLRKAGIRAINISLDRTTEGYTMLRRALYDDRIAMVDSPMLKLELAQLEYVKKKDKVDPPPKGCFTGETRVALVNGTCPTFKELCQSYGRDQTFYVYTMTPRGIAVTAARNPRVTKVATELVEILLDSFQTIRCTPDHLFMTLDQEWIRAENLTPDVSIMPLYRSRSAKGGWAGYERVWCPVREERLMTHHVSYGSVIAPDHHIHHKDECKSNNDPRNLELLTHEAHVRMHASERWASKRDAMRLGHAAYYTDTKRQEQRDRLAATRAAGKLPTAKSCSIEDCGAIAKSRGLCDVHYQRAKRRNALPERTSKQVNHRVLSVTWVNANEEVYDLTVPETHNFALATGVFVHNSKDVADSVAGAIMNATHWRSTNMGQGVVHEDGSLVQTPATRTRPSGRNRPQGRPL